MKSVCSERDLGRGSLGDWCQGLGKTTLLKTQDEFAIKEYR